MEENKQVEENPTGPIQPQQKLSIPVAIIVAGLLIMFGILLTKNSDPASSKNKTLSEQIGVSKEKMKACVDETDKTALSKKLQASVDSAMKALPQDQRGTPYSVVIGSNGVKAEIRGADSYENVKKLIDEVIAGKVAAPYTGEVTVLEEGDHLFGSETAQVKIIEYSDFECPYCKVFHQTLNKIVTESAGNVSWVYRHWPIHQNSLEKVIAAECVAKIKGTDAFWKYTDLLFGMLKTANDPVSDQL